MGASHKGFTQIEGTGFGVITGEIVFTDNGFFLTEVIASVQESGVSVIARLPAFGVDDSITAKGRVFHVTTSNNNVACFNAIAWVVIVTNHGRAR